MTIDENEIKASGAANRLLFILAGFLLFAIYQGTLPGSNLDSVIGYGAGGGVLGFAAYQILQKVPERHRGLAILIGISIATLWYMATPHNYNDCVIAGMKDANSDRAAGLVAVACRKKFGRQ